MTRFISNGNYRKNFRTYNTCSVWVYDISCDGEIKRIEVSCKIDYKKTIAKYKRNFGYKSVRIAYVDHYFYN